MPAVFALSWQCLGYMRKVFGCNHQEIVNIHVHTADVLPPRRGDCLEESEPQSFTYNNLLLSNSQAEKQDLLLKKDDFGAYKPSAEMDINEIDDHQTRL